MSYWLYQSLPGSKNAKIAALVAIVLAVSALLFFVVYPWLSDTLQPGAPVYR